MTNTLFEANGVEYKAGDDLPYDAWKQMLSLHQMALYTNEKEFKDLDETIKDLRDQLTKSEPELREELDELKTRLKYVVKSVEAFALSLDKAISL